MNSTHSHDPDQNPWEEAMSREFDTRVRDLHEAPFDLGAVKGRARSIRRRRRVAAAGGVVAVAAAIVAPLVVLSGPGDPDSKPDFAPEPPTVTIDYVLDGVWHQADGDLVQLPRRPFAYDAATIWDGQLVATRFDGEVFTVTDVIDADGEVVRSFPTAGPPAANPDGDVLAWVGIDGSVTAEWSGGGVGFGTVEMSAPGEAAAWTVAGVSGQAPCDQGPDGCLIYLNSNLTEEPMAFDSDGNSSNPVPDATRYLDVGSDGTVSAINEVTEDLDTCGGLFEVDAGDYRWQTCDRQVQQISPDAAYVVGTQSQYDGLGPREVTILDAADGTEVARYDAPERGHLSDAWAWSQDGSGLVFSVYDGRLWHLTSLTPDGTVAELADPVRADEVVSPFVIVDR